MTAEQACGGENTALTSSGGGHEDIRVFRVFGRGKEHTGWGPIAAQWALSTPFRCVSASA
jgi:hypothetical protein